MAIKDCVMQYRGITVLVVQKNATGLSIGI